MATKTPEELLQITYRPPARDWRDPRVDFEAKRGTWSYPGAAKNLEYELIFCNQSLRKHLRPES